MDNNISSASLRGRKPKLFLAVAFGVLTCLAIAAAAVRPDRAIRSEGPSAAELQRTSQTFAEVAKEAAPAVVFIKVEKQYLAHGRSAPFENAPDPFQDEFLKRFFGDSFPQLEAPEHPRRSVGQGSGFLITEDGYILTNAHVVDGVDTVQVTLADGREFDATIVGADSRSDVAVVKIEGDHLPVLPMGDSDRSEVGQWVLAVGSPFGLPGTVTSGIVSATGRNAVGIADYENFIQTDAAINPGNSGGPLLNLKGEAIGVNTAIVSRTGGYMGVGFAIPINMAREISDQLIAGGSVTRGYLGVMIQKLTPELAKSFGMESTDGVLIGDVTEGSPADKAGVRVGDVIVKFNGEDVKDLGSFRNRVARTAPQSDVPMVVLRDGKHKTLTVAVGALSADSEPGVGAAGDVGSLGLSVQPLTEDLKQRFGYEDDSGVVVARVQQGSKADQAGMEAGMLITEVNRQPVRTVEQFRKAMKEASDRVLLLVRDGEFSRFVALRLGD